MLKANVLRLTCAALTLLPSAYATAGDADAGKAVAQQWCGACHVETVAQAATQTGEDRAPPFETIAMRPWIEAERLRAFLDEDHFPMTTFRLFADEKDDVTAYLMALRQRRLGE